MYSLVHRGSSGMLVYSLVHRGSSGISVYFGAQRVF
jgi:hypothetical protein